MFARERARLFVVFGVLSAVQLIPIWCVRAHPLPDLPNHLAAVSIWHHLQDARFDFARYYELRLGATPYWTYYLSTHLLAYVVGLDAANRVMLSVCVVGLPVGFAALASRFDRSPWLALFAFPLAWNFNLAIGFVTFAVALALLPFALVAFDAFCARPSFGRGVLAGLLGVGEFFSHLLPWGMYLGCAGMIGLLHEGRTARRLASRAAVWSAGAAAGLAVIRFGSTMHMGHIELPRGMLPFGQSLREFPDWVLDVFRTRDDDVISVVLLAAWLALLATRLGLRLAPSKPNRVVIDRWLHERRAEGCLLVCLIGYFALPRSIYTPAYWWGINVRFAAPACLFASLCVPGPIRGWRRWFLVPVGVSASAFAIAVLLHWRAVNLWMTGLDELARGVAPTERVLVLAFPPWNEPSMKQNFAQSSNALRQAYYGGYNPDNFDEGFPIRYKQRFPAPRWRFPETFRWESHARYYDWLLAFQAPADLLRGHTGEARLAGVAGRWTLWRLPPRIDVPPRPPYPP